MPLHVLRVARAPVLGAFFLLACDDGASPGSTDADGDGWSEAEGDCDDTDPAVHPGQTEVPVDGVDQDCDGGDACYQDGDADGFGSTVVVPSSDLECTASWESTLTTDCNDADASRFPGAPEVVADGVDQDCDSGDACYGDDDGDGYGTETAVGSADLDCADAGESALGTDCDDARSDVNPSMEETCGDGVDNDCDGSAGTCQLAGELDLSLADAKIYALDDGVQAGSALVTGDMDGDGTGDLLVGELDGDTVGVFFGPVEGLQPMSRADAVLLGDGGVHTGAVLATSDIDGDGQDDVLIGADGDVEGGEDAGAAYLVWGPVPRSVDLSRDGVKLVGLTGNRAGTALAAGDVDDDGVVEVVVGAASGAYGRGMAYVVQGPYAGRMPLDSTGIEFQGEETGSRAGDTAAVADVDGDGVQDVIIGAPFQDDTDGAVYVILGPANRGMSLSLAEVRLAGDESLAGISLATGDVDGDGMSDLVIGASFDDTGGRPCGAADIVLGPVTTSMDLAKADAKLLGVADEDYAGTSVATGDVDGDGDSDVLVGAPGRDTTGEWAGAAYLVYGPVGGTVSLADARAAFLGEEIRDYAGSRVAAGDLDADGAADVVVGAPKQSSGGDWGGAAYVLYGGGL